jgi:hypothetical protein
MSEQGPGPIIVEIDPLDALLADADDKPLTEADLESIRQLNLTSCDFVGDSGCCDPNCWQCHSPIGPANLRCLAENLATAGLLYWAWQLRDLCPTWKPGCGELPLDLPPLMKEALASPRIGAFLRKQRDP